MNNKIKNIVVSSVFIAFIALFVVLCAVCYFNPVETSEAERRPLAQFPEEITWEGILDKTVINVGRLAREGMRDTDKTILEIMLSDGC